MTSLALMYSPQDKEIPPQKTVLTGPSPTTTYNIHEYAMTYGGVKMVAVHKCGQRYIHMTVLKAVYHVIPWGLGGWGR